MTPAHIRLVQESFRRLAAAPEPFAAEFYERLFFEDPSLRPMFRADLRSQGRKLMMALTYVISGLNRLDAIMDDVRSLARRHSAYGVKRGHYDTVATVLLATLEARLGPAFTPEVRAAWTEAYTLLSRTMIAAAEPSARSAA